MGSLFATQAGAAFIQSRIDLSELCAIITDEEESVMNKRTVLWAVAHIAIQNKGYQYLLVGNRCFGIFTLFTLFNLLIFLKLHIIEN